MIGNLAKQSKALWAIGLGVVGAIGVGAFVKTDSGQPLVTALVEEIRGGTNNTAKPESKAITTDAAKSVEKKLETAKITEPKQVEQEQAETKSVEIKPEIEKVEKPIAKAPAEKPAEPIIKMKNAADDSAAIPNAVETKKANDKTKIASIDNPETPPADAVKKPVAVVVPKPPSIDLLRVSPDGSVVIAGRADPNTIVMAFNGNAKIADTKSTATGDYVFVFDDPLENGEHELIVKAGKNEANMLSSLTSGVIILPENKADMIVLLSKPGEASKILQMPSNRFGPKSQKTANLNNDPSKGENSNAIKQTSKLPVVVNAVDVEDKRYYIAGAATPKSTVNIYIDNIFKGKAITGEEGAYLFYGREAITVGKHALRVDMLATDNVTVVSRAEVVLEHEVEKIMAMNETTPNEPEKKSEPNKKTVDESFAKDTKMQPIDNAAISSGSTGKKIADIGKAIVKMSDAAKPNEDSKKTSDLKQTKDMKPVENAAISSGSTGKKIADIGKATVKMSGEVKLDEKQISEAGKPDSNSPVNTETTINSDGKKIIKSGSSVIIRRGDSLWRVSRRKFGLGSKYTIIYSANRDQVQNPHRIYPGQVLKIPEETNSTQ